MGAVSTSIAMHFASAGAAASSSGDGGGGPRRLPCSRLDGHRPALRVHDGPAVTEGRSHESRITESILTHRKISEPSVPLSPCEPTR